MREAHEVINADATVVTIQGSAHAVYDLPQFGSERVVEVVSSKAAIATRHIVPAWRQLVLNYTPQSRSI